MCLTVRSPVLVPVRGVRARCPGDRLGLGCLSVLVRFFLCSGQAVSAGQCPPRGHPRPCPGSTRVLVTGCATCLTVPSLFQKTKKKSFHKPPPTSPSKYDQAPVRRTSGVGQRMVSRGRPSLVSWEKDPDVMFLEHSGSLRHGTATPAPFSAGVSGAPAPGVALPSRPGHPGGGGPAEGQAEPSLSHGAPQTRRFSPPPPRRPYPLEPGSRGRAQ